MVIIFLTLPTTYKYTFKYSIFRSNVQLIEVNMATPAHLKTGLPLLLRIDKRYFESSK